MEGTRVEVNGLSFNVVDQGAGPAVLLLHGFPDSSEMWRFQVPVLTEAGYRVIAPDQRGFGDSDRPEGVEHYAAPNLIGDVTGLLDALGVDDVHVVGHDWGAFVAWATAAFLGERARGLVALSVGHPNAFGLAGPEQWMRSWYMLWFQFPGVAEEVFAKDDWKALRQWVGAMGGSPDLERQIALAARPGALTAGLNWYRANVAPETFVGGGEFPLPPVACPVVGVWSSGDGFLTEQQMTGSEQFVQGPWRYVRIDGAGHWFPVERPDEVNRLLLEALAAARR